jgi:hypothetical protein
MTEQIAEKFITHADEGRYVHAPSSLRTQRPDGAIAPPHLSVAGEPPIRKFEPRRDKVLSLGGEPSLMFF